MLHLQMNIPSCIHQLPKILKIILLLLFILKIHLHYNSQCNINGIQFTSKFVVAFARGDCIAQTHFK